MILKSLNFFFSIVNDNDYRLHNSFYQVLFNNLIFYHKIQLYINILSILNNITDKSETYIIYITPKIKSLQSIYSSSLEL